MVSCIETNTPDPGRRRGFGLGSVPTAVILFTHAALLAILSVLLTLARLRNRFAKSLTSKIKFCYFVNGGWRLYGAPFRPLSSDSSTFAEVRMWKKAVHHVSHVHIIVNSSSALQSPVAPGDAGGFVVAKPLVG